MGNSFVLFYVSIVIYHGQFYCGNRGHTQNKDFPWVKSHFPVGKWLFLYFSCTEMDGEKPPLLFTFLRTLTPGLSCPGIVCYNYNPINMLINWPRFLKRQLALIEG